MMDYSTLFNTLKDVQYILLPQIAVDIGHDYLLKRYDISNEYYVQYSTFVDGDDRTLILRLYRDGYTIFEFSANTSTKYFTTITDNSLRIAYWKLDHPRYYAKYDPDNGRNNDKFTYFEFPSEYDYYFQRSTVQNTLAYEEYFELDTEVNVMQEEFKDLGFVSTALVLSNSYNLDTTEVLDMLLVGLNGMNGIKEKQNV